MPVRHVGLAQIFVKTNRHSVDNMEIVTSTLFICDRRFSGKIISPHNRRKDKNTESFVTILYDITTHSAFIYTIKYFL